MTEASELIYIYISSYIKDTHVWTDSLVEAQGSGAAIIIAISTSPDINPNAEGKWGKLSNKQKIL
jgi:hypothetical protein